MSSSVPAALRAAAASALALVLIGCAAEARPGPPEPAPEGVAAPAARATADDAPTPACEPGSTKTCVLREVTLDGYRYCHEDVALCRPDGLDWYACGSWVKTDDGWRPLGPGRGY